MARTAIDLLGVVSPSTQAVANADSADPSLVTTLVPGVATGVAGAALIAKHRVLGFIGGDALGLNAYRLYRGNPGDRSRALGNLIAPAAVIVGSLSWKAHPFWGGVVGFFAGVTVASFVPGSNAYAFRKGK